MKDNFDECLKMLLHHEGGYVNHPKDPGGETNLGVTKRVYEKWGGTKDMKDLTVEDVAPIYKKEYWDRCKCDDLESGVDWAVFDWAVNSGTGRAAKAIQKICGAAQDGAIGPKTLALIGTQNTQYVIEEFGKIRQDFYESLKTFDTFGKGWTRRNKETTEKALEMIEDDDD
jgi:lysozyme family protein|tara:strand:- start:49 stop:561 length:513 start_codon:yes stop_codon:yes gene_type:complete